MSEPFQFGSRCDQRFSLETRNLQIHKKNVSTSPAFSNSTAPPAWPELPARGQASGPWPIRVDTLREDTGNAGQCGWGSSKVQHRQHGHSMTGQRLRVVFGVTLQRASRGHASGPPRLALASCAQAVRFWNRTN